MKIKHLHSWDVAPAAAIQLQEQLREQALIEDQLGEVRAAAGVDVDIRERVARAAVVVLRYPDLAVLETAAAEAPLTFPYIPGLLAFREAPAILSACEKLRIEPDLFIFDRHGTAHPRRFGLACHVGIILDKPSIGCAKSPLCGQHGGLLQQVGAWAPLLDEGEVIGAAVRTRERVKPVYVSPGHRIGLETAIRYVLTTCSSYRLPEPCRLAHLAAKGAASA